MSILSYNGGSVVAMSGRNCVAIASDKRLGQQMLTLNMDFGKVFKINQNVLMGITGLATDVLTMKEKIEFRVNLYKMKEQRDIEPRAFSAMVSSLLYERRFGPYFVEPVIAGIHPTTNAPFLMGSDLIGCPSTPGDFVCAGTASDSMMTLCEAVYEPALEKEDLFETISQVFLSALDRDSISGWGAEVYLLSPEGMEVRVLRSRQD